MRNDKPKKIAFKKGRSQCIFCGAFGTTKEHIWPHWLRHHIPQTETTRFHTGSVSGIVMGKGGFLPVSKVRTKIQNGDPHTQKLNVACAYCNNNWMSKLQESCKPTLIRLMDGNNFSLNQAEKNTVSAWVGMYVMVSEFLDPPTSAIPQTERDHLRCMNRIPNNWFIWIGKYRGTRWNGVRNHFGLHPARAIEEKLVDNTIVTYPSSFLSQSTAFVIKNLFIMAFSSSIPHTKFDPLEFGNAHGIRTIWPVIDGADSTRIIEHNDFSADQISRSFVHPYRRPFVRPAWEAR